MSKKMPRKELDKKLGINNYRLNNAKSYANQITEEITRISMAWGLVEEGLLDAEMVKGFIERQIKEINQSVDDMKSYLRVDE